MDQRERMAEAYRALGVARAELWELERNFPTTVSVPKDWKDWEGRVKYSILHLAVAEGEVECVKLNISQEEEGEKPELGAWGATPVDTR